MLPTNDELDTKWGPTDDAEFQRLVREMQSDATWQLQLFTFALTATAIILGVLAPNPTATGQLPAGMFFLTPLLILIPSSLIVLNRARTRNRKSSYIICYLDAKRLRAAGVSNETSLDEVRRRSDVPWETALHILGRRGKPHLPPALRYMGYSYAMVELLCIGCALYVSITQRSLSAQRVVLVVGFLWISAVVYRWVNLWKFKYRLSIQYFATQWFEDPYRQPLRNCPKYLEQWAGETFPTKRKPKTSDHL